MPWNRADYPLDWDTVRTALAARSGNRCEWNGCGARNHTYIVRDPEDLERFMEVDPRDAELPVVRVVLTSAHTCSCIPFCGRLDHLLHLCQLHHNRLDMPMRQAHAAASRLRRKREALQAIGQTELAFDEGKERPYADTEVHAIA